MLHHDGPLSRGHLCIAATGHLCLKSSCYMYKMKAISGFHVNMFTDLRVCVCVCMWVVGWVHVGGWVGACACVYSLVFVVDVISLYNSSHSFLMQEMYFFVVRPGEGIFYNEIETRFVFTQRGLFNTFRMSHSFPGITH